eukprot:scaffold74926_cov63-Phaeocystis_antarctica.AAC.2
MLGPVVVVAVLVDHEEHLRVGVVAELAAVLLDRLRGEDRVPDRAEGGDGDGHEGEKRSLGPHLPRCEEGVRRALLARREDAEDAVGEDGLSNQSDQEVGDDGALIDLLVVCDVGVVRERDEGRREHGHRLAHGVRADEEVVRVRLRRDVVQLAVVRVGLVHLNPALPLRR